MKFKVSEKIKGSLILKSIGRPVKAGSTVYVEGHTLYADDIQRAIKTKLLTPENPAEKVEIKENIINKTTEAVIINKTDRVVIIGDISIRPNGSTIKNISKLDMNSIKKCIEKGLIQVIVNVDEELFENNPIKKQPKKPIEDLLSKEKTELDNGIDILEENLKPEDELAKIIEDADRTDEARKDGSKAVVWDFRAQETKAPQVVPKAAQKIIDLEQDDEDVDMVDALDEVNDVKEDETEMINNKIESIQKKLAQKKTSKKKDIKVIKQKFSEDGNVVQSLDSMGNPLKEDMSHMVDGGKDIDVSFVDQEQAQINIDEAKKRGSGFNRDIDLD